MTQTATYLPILHALLMSSTPLHRDTIARLSHTGRGRVTNICRDFLSLWVVEVDTNTWVIRDCWSAFTHCLSGNDKLPNLSGEENRQAWAEAAVKAGYGETAQQCLANRHPEFWGQWTHAAEVQAHG